MTPEQYGQVKQLFYAVQEMEPEHRDAFLAERCNGDRALRDAVVKLLGSSAQVEGFIEKAAYEVLSETLVDEEPGVSVAGKRIGAYRVLREINHGGMGTVYLAERDDNVYQKQVAIKILRGFYSEELRRRFYDERRILARLDHPNITKLLDGGTTHDGLPYYVMDYVEGVALDQYCEQNNLSINERLKLFCKVCEAVQYAHRNLVIHRDLKPSNILVTADRVPQLLDFGIAKVFQDDENVGATKTNLRVMTPDYASPEQISGKVITTVSDVYSLGIILHELLTGSRPFHFRTNSLEEIIQVITKRELRRPSQAVAELETSRARKAKGQTTNPQLATRNPQSLRGDLDNIILKSLSKEPERRYASVEQFSDDIRRHLEGLPILARPDTFRYRASKFVKRNKIAVAVAAGILTFLFGSAIAIVRQTQIAAHAAKVSAEQRNRALREQAKAERINKFFQETLAFANPAWYAPGFNRSRDVTVAEALDEAARKIENDLNEEPEVKAEILLTIGDTYASVGRFADSERPLELAVLLTQQVYGPESIKFADALYFLANTKRGLNKPEEKQQLYDRAHAIYSRHAEKGTQYPYFLLDYAGSFSTWGRHAEAVQITREAVEILKRSEGDRDTNNAVAVARGNLSTAYFLWGDLDNALAEIETAYEMMKPPNLAIVQILGRTYHAKGDLNKAEPLLIKAAEMLGQQNRLNFQAGVLISLANLSQERGDHRKAEALMAQAIKTYRRLVAPNDPSLLGPLVNQALILSRSGKRKEGGRILQDALRQMSAEQRRNLEGSLGECLLLQKRYAEAEPHLQNYYHSLKATQHHSSPRLKKAQELVRAVTDSKPRTPAH